MDGKESTMPFGVYSIDDMKQFGRDRNWCPYFLSRFAVSTTNCYTFQKCRIMSFRLHMRILWYTVIIIC